MTQFVVNPFTNTLDATGGSSVGPGTLETLTGNSGGPILPSGNNINTFGSGSITISGSGSTLTSQLIGLTNHNVLLGAGTSTITSLDPGSTSGVALISQGSGADPIFGTVLVAGGGTGLTTISAGDIIYASAANTFSRLPAGSNSQVLTLAAGLPSWAALPASGVTSVSGTANRITSTGGSTPVIDISGSYVGQSSITTLGTIATGVWNGTTIAVANGGTGATTLTAHGVLIGEATSAITATAAGTAGQVLQSGGGAADPTYSTATYPSTVAQASYLYGSASNVVSALAPSAFPAIGGFPTYDGTNGIWFNPSAYVYEWDDFITEISNTSLSKLCWQRMAVNGGNIDIPASAQDPARPGVVQIQITTSAGSGSGIILGNSNASPLIFGAGRCICNFWFKTSNISDATDTYTTLIGFTASNVGTVGNNALCFSLNSGVNSGNWQMIGVKSGGGTTTANSSTGTDANWHKYTIDVNAAGTSAAFYIDGVQLANSPITTNIPTAANQPVAASCSILRTGGSTNTRNAQVDLFTLWIALTTPR